MTFVPIRDAVIIAQAQPSTIRQWAKLDRVDTETADDGEPMYEVAGLVRCEREDREARVQHAYAKLAMCLLKGA